MKTLSLFLIGSAMFLFLGCYTQVITDDDPLYSGPIYEPPPPPPPPPPRPPHPPHPPRPPYDPDPLPPAYDPRPTPAPPPADYLHRESGNHRGPVQGSQDNSKNTGAIRTNEDVRSGSPGQTPQPNTPVTIPTRGGDRTQSSAAQQNSRDDSHTARNRGR